MLPTGYRMELVAADPDVISPTLIEFDGNGRMYVGEMISYMMDAERQPRARADQPHQPVGEHEGRRPLRQAHGLRRQARRAAHDPAAPGRRHPHERDRLRRSREVDRHQRRRRRRQARGRLHRHRPERRRQHRAPEGGPALEHGQLDLHDLQPVPHPLDADRLPARADRPERRPVGPRVGRRREAVVRGRGRRTRPDELPVPDSLRRVHAVPGGRRPRRPRPAPAAAAARRRIRTARRAWRTASRRTSPSSGPRPASATCRAASAARACRRRT